MEIFVCVDFDKFLDAIETKACLEYIKELNISKTESMNNRMLRSKVEESEYYEMIRNLKTDRMTKTIMIILAICQFLNIVVFMARDPIQNLVFQDINYHIMTVDLENWISFSQIHPALFVDVGRAAREGWIENDSFLPYEQVTAVAYAMG